VPEERDAGPPSPCARCTYPRARPPDVEHVRALRDLLGFEHTICLKGICNCSETTEIAGLLIGVDACRHLWEVVETLKSILEHLLDEFRRLGMTANEALRLADQKVGTRLGTLTHLKSSIGASIARFQGLALILRNAQQLGESFEPEVLGMLRASSRLVEPEDKLASATASLHRLVRRAEGLLHSISDWQERTIAKIKELADQCQAR